MKKALREYAWRPFPGPQTEFCRRTEYEVFFGGAKGPGKTDCGIAEALRFIHHPKYHGLILRRTFPRLQEIIDRCWLLYPLLGGEYRSGEHRWYFPSGAKISLGHVQHETDKYNFHGKEFHYIFFDELTEFEENMYTFILANVRCSVPGLTLRIRSSSNPGGIGHVWVKKRFVDPCKPVQTRIYKGGDGKEHEMFAPVVYVDPESGTTRCFVPATVYDNPALMINDPSYVRRLEMLPALEKMRLLHGVWDAFEGQVFSELSKLKHGADDFEIPYEWKKFMVFDWGYARPWCSLWFAVDFDGVLYLYREYYGAKNYEDWKAGKIKDISFDIGTRQTNNAIIQKIQEIETNERIRVRIADPACWSPTKIKGSNKVHGPSFVEDAQKEGMFFLKADNDRIRGIQQVHQRLEMEITIDNDTGEVLDEKPRLVVFNSCRRFWEEMQGLREDEKNPEDVDTEQPDEGYDCFRYGCMYRPVPPKKAQEKPAGTFKSERNRMIKAKKYAARHGVSLSIAYGMVR